MAEARDLDGHPSYLWLAEGAHRVVVYRAGYARFEEEVDVHRGVVEDLKIRLEKGESVPPVGARRRPRRRALSDQAVSRQGRDGTTAVSVLS